MCNESIWCDSGSLLMYTNSLTVDCVWNVMAQAQKPDLVFRRKFHLNRWGHQLSRLLAAEVCASAVVMLDTTCSEVVWRVLATHSICQFPPHFLLPCITVCHHVSTRFQHNVNRLYTSSEHKQRQKPSRHNSTEKFVVVIFITKAAIYNQDAIHIRRHK